MPVNTIPIPESYRTYMENSAVRSAVQDLLESKPGKIPNDFDWKSIQQYHEALFSAYRVRRDYTMMLFALMNEVCLKPAEEKWLGKNAILPLQNWWEDTEPSPKIIWSDGLHCFLKPQEDNSEPLGFYLAITDEDERLHIQISVPIIGDGWGYNEESEWWEFKGDDAVTSVKGKSEISVGPLREIIKRALDKI